MTGPVLKTLPELTVAGTPSTTDLIPIYQGANPLKKLTWANAGAYLPFLQVGTGAESRTVASKLQDVISVRDFGAVGDGSTNDTVKIQAALTKAGVAGKSVMIPDTGTFYVLTDDLTVPDNVNVLGPGWIKQTVAEKNALNLGNNCQVIGVKIQGTGLTNNTNPLKNIGVYIGAKKDCKVFNCDISGFEGSGIFCQNAQYTEICDNNIHDNTWGLDAAFANAADIAFYSASAGSGKVIIIGNKCVSNNSQGIAFSLLGIDKDAIISGNIINTLDSSGVEIASGGNRRHGIMTNYASQSDVLRVLVTNNFIRNTQWTGVYGQASTNAVGPTVIDTNYISNVGYDTTSTLSGAVYVAGRGNQPIIVKGNISVDFQNTNSATGSFVANATVMSGNVVFENNHSYGSLSNGYYIATGIRNVTVSGGSVRESTRRDVSIVLSGGATNDGLYTISGLDCVRSNLNFPCVHVDLQGAPMRVLITGNRFTGMGTGAGSENVGVQTRSPLLTDIVGNTFTGFVYGVDATAYIPPTVRYFSTSRWDNNSFRTVTTAFGAGTTGAADATWPVCGNVLTSVTNLSSGGTLGGFAIVYDCERRGDKLFVNRLNAAPTTGTWAVGDRVFATTPVSGNPSEFACSVAGQPGTWLSGAILT